MGRKAGIEKSDIAQAAARIADRDGLDAATLSAVARELGIKTPSLYNHVDGLEGLRRLLAIHGSEIVLSDFKAAVDGIEGAEALKALSEADREFASRHPGLYSSFLPAPTEESDPELYTAMAAPAFLVAHVMLDMGIPQEEALHLVRALRALLHGFLELEANRGFGMPIDIDESFDRSVDLMIEAITAAAARHK